MARSAAEARALAAQARVGHPRENNRCAQDVAGLADTLLAVHTSGLTHGVAPLLAPLPLAERASQRASEESKLGLGQTLNTIKPVCSVRMQECTENLGG